MLGDPGGFTRDLEIAGEITAGACRDEGEYGARAMRAQDATGDLADRAIAADGEHQVAAVFGELASMPFGIAETLGLTQADIGRACLERTPQRGPEQPPAPPSGRRIENDADFHDLISPAMTEA